MNLQKKGNCGHRGVIGVESAIVMIAFVIVAAALAFVVLNMGFSTTQKAKTTIISSLGEASSALEIAGKVTGIGDVGASKLNVTSVPIKVASGGDSINLDGNLTSIIYFSNDVQYDNIYKGVLKNGVYVNSSAALDGAVTRGMVNTNVITGPGDAEETAAFLYFAVNRNDNTILDMGEHAVLLVQHKEDERTTPLDNMRIEIMTPVGSPLTIERQIPNITTLTVDLG